MNRSYLFFVLVCSLLLAACNPTSLADNLTQPSEIHDPQLGEPYTSIKVETIRTMNCDGANPKNIVSRSLLQEQTTFFEVEVEAGGLVRGTPIPTPLQAELEARIRTAIGAQLGDKYQQSISSELETNPGKALEHAISWKETRVNGMFDVNFQDGIARITFEKIVGVELAGRTSKEVSCDIQTQSSPPILPTSPAPNTLPGIPTDHSEFEAVPELISLWAIEENGFRFDINRSGVYNIAYIDDAYSPWPNEQYADYQGWTTIVRIYANRPVEWGTTDYGLIGPINQDEYLGPGGYYLDKSDAINVTKGENRNFKLESGDYLTLVTLDEKGRYGDNRGKIDIAITYFGP